MTEFQDWLNGIFQIDNETSAPILITIFVFGAGLAFQYSLDFVKTWHRRSMLRRVTRYNIEGLRYRLIEQSKSFYVTASQFGQLSSEPIQSQRAEFENAQILKEIGYDQIYQAFFYGIYNFRICRKKMRLKSFQKTWEVVHSLTYWQQKATSDFESFLEKYNSYNAPRNEVVIKLGAQLQQFFLPSYNEKHHIPEDLKQGILAIHSNWVRLPYNTVPKILNSKLTIPLLELFKSHMNVEGINAIRTTLNEETLYTRNILTLEKNSGTQFRHFGSLLKAKAFQLKIILNILS